MLTSKKTLDVTSAKQRRGAVSTVGHSLAASAGRGSPAARDWCIVLATSWEAVWLKK